MQFICWLGALKSDERPRASTTKFIFLFSCQECPDGIVHEENFREIYGKFFPHGSK